MKKSVAYFISGVILIPLEFIVVGSIFLAIGAIITALVIVPAYVMQFFRLFKILRLWKSKSADQNKQSKDKQ